MNKATSSYLHGMDKMNIAMSKLRFISTGLLQTDVQWEDEDISGLGFLISDIQDLLDESYQIFKEEGNNV